MHTSIIVSDSQKNQDFVDDDWLPILQEEWDDHFQRYKELFITYCRRAPYHVKTSYRGGFVARTKRRQDGSLYNPPLYDALADMLVTKHLDPYRYRYVHDDGLWKREEFWLGLRIGKRTRVKLIDLDNKHNILGYYDGHFCDFPRPIVNYTLEDFQRLKRVYDFFPRHKWCISSATMGLHVWELLPSPQTAEDIERQNRPRLKTLGLGKCEVYPSPQLQDQCVRRPFGKDYYSLTEDGPVDNWMWQLDYFESSAFPSFSAIVDGIIRRLHFEWAAYDRLNGLLVEANPNSPYVFEDLVDTRQLRRDILKVIRWRKQGFPEASLPPLCSVIKDDPGTGHGDPLGHDATIPLLCLKSVIKEAAPAANVSWDIDLRDVNSGQWVESCVEWAGSGLPGEDTLMPVVANLARWFYYVELIDVPRLTDWSGSSNYCRLLS